MVHPTKPLKETQTGHATMPPTEPTTIPLTECTLVPPIEPLTEPKKINLQRIFYEYHLHLPPTIKFQTCVPQLLTTEVVFCYLPQLAVTC